jgi:hypothetical protein
MAINAGQREAAERLLNEGVNVNAKPPGYHWRGTALHVAGWAVHHGHRELVELLTVDGR